MYRTELEPLPLNTRGTQRLWMLVVAVLSFGAGAATVGYVNQLSPFDSGEATAATSPTQAPRPAAVKTDIWQPPVPASSSVYHGRPERVPSTTLTATALRRCAWSPPVPATSSAYGADCFVPTVVPAAHPPMPLLAPGQVVTLPLQVQPQAAQATQADNKTAKASGSLCLLEPPTDLTLPPLIQEQVRQSTPGASGRCGPIADR